MLDFFEEVPEWVLKTACGILLLYVVVVVWFLIPPLNFKKERTKLYQEKVVASWYGDYFHGRKMANGHVFDMNEVSVAHRDLPLGTRVRVVNLDNQKEIDAIVTDRGPYPKDFWGNYTREIDLSKQAAEELGFVNQGLTRVNIEVYEEPKKQNG